MTARESPIQKRIMLAVGSLPGTRIFRNNCGVATYPDGSVVRYGIANPGGSDLLGWTTRLITGEMVGRDVAIFTALEVKRDGGEPTDQQINFINAVRRAGGIAGVVRSVAEAVAAIERKLLP